MSSQPASIPLFGDAYLADTTHLTAEEHGAYLLLMITAWRQEDCSLPCDDKKLAKIVRMSLKKWLSIKETVVAFWTIEGGRMHQKRLLKEWHFVRQKRQSNRQSAQARWNKQSAENKGSDECERISEGNAPPPPPPPLEEPSGSSPPVSPTGKSVSRAHTLPPDWAPTLTPDAQRIVDGWPPGKFDHEVARFRDHAADKGRTSKDWQAAFRTWITKSDEWMKQNGNRNYQTAGGASSRHRGPVDNRNSFLRSLDETIGRSGPGQPDGPD